MNLDLGAIIFFFLGIVLYLLQLPIFKQNVSHAVLILEFLLACVPILGTICEAVFITIRSIFVTLPDEEPFNVAFFEPNVYDNFLGRWLFNKLDWEDYDRKNRESDV